MSFDISKSFKLTLDNTKIEEDLTNFPIAVVLSSGTGITNYDSTAVFDELYIDPNDDFTGTNGDAPNSYRWIETDTGSYLSIQNNKLEYDSQDVSDVYSFVKTNYNLAGDFDIQVDVEELNGGDPSDSTNHSRLQISDGTNYSWIRFERDSGGKQFNVGGSTSSSTNITRTIDVSKLRITRSGSMIKGYYWSGIQWEWDGNTSGFTFSETNIGEIYALLFFNESGDGSARWNSTFDNFTVNSGTIIWPEHPYRKKIAITTTVSGVETQLPVEIENWDALNEKAILWTKIPTVYSGINTELTFYYDATMSGNDVRSAADVSDSFNGEYGTTPNPTLWQDVSTNGFYVANGKVSNYGDTWELLKAAYRFTGDFDVQLDLDTTTMPSEDGYYSRVYFRAQEDGDIQHFIGFKYDTTYGRCYTANYKDTTWGTQQFYSTSDLTGKVRLVRTGSTITVYYWNGSGWSALQSYDFGSVYVARLDINHVCPSTQVTTYYDNYIVNSADSITGYVGDTGEAPAQQVWDSNFVAVYHMAQDPTSGSGSILDSTGNNNGTAYNMESEDLIDFDIGKGLDFDGSDEYIDCGTVSVSDTTDPLTLSLWLKPSSNYSDFRWFCGREDSATGTGFALRNGGAGNRQRLRFQWIKSGSGIIIETNDNVLLLETSIFATIFYDGSETVSGLSLNINGGSATYSSEGLSSVTPGSVTVNASIGARIDGGGATDAKYGLVILSDIKRSEAWDKTFYYSLNDNLITFSESFVGHFTGYIYEINDTNPVSRVVRLYDRATGELLNSTTSSGDGYYYLSTTYNGEHYIIAFDDEAGTPYNLVGLDRMIPQEGV